MTKSDHKTREVTDQGVKKLEKIWTLASGKAPWIQFIGSTI